MNRFFDRFQMFINEQKEYFHKNLYSDFNHNWDEDFWYIGTHGTGWLQGTGKGTLLFNKINKTTKGFDIKVTIDSEEYTSFIKAVVIAVYRKKGGISTTVAVAIVLILKRWYYSLFMLTGHKHPVYLTTTVLQDAMDTYQSASKTDDPNVADTLGRCVRLQTLINHYAFCISQLNFQSNAGYNNRTNYTKRAKEVQDLKKEKELNDSKVNDKDKLITISTFLNIVTLINKCETVGEKILLNLVLLLIVTGFRSIEAITLREDSLVKREIEDLVTRQKMKKNGSALYFLGIKYAGAKGAGERIHWVEPLAVSLVEAIFSAVRELTVPFREHLIYLRDKNFSSYLPKEIYNLPSDLIELNDIDQFIVGTASVYRGQGGKREKTYKALKNAGVNPASGYELGRRDSKVYYRKCDLSQYIADNFRNNKEQAKEPCIFVWKSKEKEHSERYEDLLFIHEYRSTNLARLLVNKANPVPFDNLNINDFLGGGRKKSIFEKFNLKEPNGEFSSLTSHIPRHNINAFLAMAGIDGHLQAMLMGRVDISQNETYEHLAIEHRIKAVSILSYTSKIITNKEGFKDEFQSLTPSEKIKKTGKMICSINLDMEKGIKANLHTFDGRDDIAKFKEVSFLDGLFDDIKDSFEELKELEGDDAAKQLLERHADLYPLIFGSCTYNIPLWGCPYDLKCQSGDACNYFTLTGRADEIDKLLNLKTSLENNLRKSKEVISINKRNIVNSINLKLENIALIETKLKEALVSKSTVNIYESLTNNSEYREITTLADLFALEHINQQEIKQ